MSASCIDEARGTGEQRMIDGCPGKGRGAEERHAAARFPKGATHAKQMSAGCIDKAQGRGDQQQMGWVSKPRTTRENGQ